MKTYKVVDLKNATPLPDHQGEYVSCQFCGSEARRVNHAFKTGKITREDRRVEMLYLRVEHRRHVDGDDR